MVASLRKASRAFADLDAFKVRDNEVDASVSRATWRELVSLRRPTDAKGLAVHKAQLEALIRRVPATVAAQFTAATLAAISLIGMVPGWQIGLWLAVSGLICGWRGTRAWRLRRNPDYARRKPADVRAITIVIAALAVLWLVPPIFWFDDVPVSEQILLIALLLGLISAGSVTLSTVPPAAVAYVGIVGLGQLIMAVKLGEPVMMLLGLVYIVVLGWAVLMNARQFVGHALSRFELQEHSDLVELLREFEASGSGGLWELDADRRIVFISGQIAHTLGMRPEDMVGRTVAEQLDPTGDILRLSHGMRTLFAHLDEGTAFRDVAFPSAAGRWWSLSGKPVLDPNGVLNGWRGVGSDITDTRISGKDSVRIARSDPLTGLANRLLIREQLEGALLAQVRGEGDCAFLLVDLDRFKLVNDTLGHAVGDQLLCEVARRLEAIVGANAEVGRLGGDEFAIVWRGSPDPATLGELASTIIKDLSRTVTIGPAQLHIGATIGIARGQADNESDEQLMRAADLALYRAKEEGRGGYAIFERSMYLEAEDLRLLENDVRNALSENRLTLAYQPIVSSTDDELVGREALLRWTHPTRGEIPPDRFIPIIEDAGLIHQIGDWVIREACAEAVRWPDHLRVAVNVSAAQLSGCGLSETVLNALAVTGLAPDRLELEVTESIFIGDDPTTLAALERLRSIGVRLVLDDFGKGYSSFGYLSRARFSKIKIDRSFVRGAADGERDCTAIVRAILALARGLGIETTAEGVEREQEAAVMRKLGCSQMQGFHFGRPVPATMLSRPKMRRRA